MRVFLYEWITGGGLVDQTGQLPASMLREGAAMLSALAADFAALPDCEVTVLRDMRLSGPALPHCRIVEVHSSEHWREEFDQHVSQSDASLVVAPEFDGILRDTLRRAADAGAGVLNSGDEFVAIASNKQRTAERLGAAGLRTPEAVLLDADQETLPTDFEYPGVLKPIDGAGSQHMLKVEGPLDEPPPYPWPRRLERFYPGKPASVSLLCGGGRRTALPPCWQHLSADGRFTYLGGALIRDKFLAQRARALAIQAADAMPPAAGYVGVDVVLGAAADGSDDVVIEVNPRLTTSYIGLRAAVKQNLVQAMLDCAAGRDVQVTVEDWCVEFAADGTRRSLA